MSVVALEVKSSGNEYTRRHKSNALLEGESNVEIEAQSDGGQTIAPADSLPKDQLAGDKVPRATALLEFEN